MLPDEIARPRVEGLQHVAAVREVHGAVVDDRRRLVPSGAPHSFIAQTHASRRSFTLSRVISVERAVAPRLIVAPRHQPVARIGIAQHRVGDRHVVLDLARHREAASPGAASGALGSLAPRRAAASPAPPGRRRRGAGLRPHRAAARRPRRLMLAPPRGRPAARPPPAAPSGGARDRKRGWPRGRRLAPPPPAPPGRGTGRRSLSLLAPRRASCAPRPRAPAPPAGAPASPPRPLRPAAVALCAAAVAAARPVIRCRRPPAVRLCRGFSGICWALPGVSVALRASPLNTSSARLGSRKLGRLLRAEEGRRRRPLPCDPRHAKAADRDRRDKMRPSAWMSPDLGHVRLLLLWRRFCHGCGARA